MPRDREGRWTFRLRHARAAISKREGGRSKKGSLTLCVVCIILHTHSGLEIQEQMRFFPAILVRGSEEKRDFALLFVVLQGVMTKTDSSLP